MVMNILSIVSYIHRDARLGRVSPSRIALCVDKLVAEGGRVVRSGSGDAAEYRLGEQQPT